MVLRSENTSHRRPLSVPFGSVKSSVFQRVFASDAKSPLTLRSSWLFWYLILLAWPERTESCKLTARILTLKSKTLLC